MSYCIITRQDCEKEKNGEDCLDCMEFITTCDKCHCGGHTDSDGWQSLILEDGNIQVLCDDCFDIETSKG